MASKYIKKFKVPNNFENILSDFAKEILRNQPKDIIEFGIEYFKGLETNTKLDYKNKGENRPENYKRPENQQPNIISAQNKLEISQEDKNRLQRSMDKIDRINKDPEPILEKEEKKDEEINTQNEVELGRHISKYIHDEETNTVVKKTVTKEVYIKKEETIIKNGQVIKKEATEERYISGNDRNGQHEEEEPVFERPPENVEPESQGRYGGMVEENKDHKKDYDDWFTKHSIDKQVIDYKPEEKKDDNFERNKCGYNTWFKNHSERSIDHKEGYDDWFTRHSIDKQVIDYKPEEKKDDDFERNKCGYNTWFRNHSEGSFDQSQENEEKNKIEYTDWFDKHSKDKMVIDYKPKEKKYEAVERCEIDYPTWFENHSKLTNKNS